MKEILRFSHIYFKDKKQIDYVLKDFNLTVYSNTIYYIFSRYPEETDMIRLLLTGLIQPVDGRIYVHKKKLESYTYKTASHNGIFWADPDTNLFNNLSIHQNICIMGPQMFHPFILPKLFERKTVRELCSYVGLRYHSWQLLTALSPFEKLLVCIAKFIYAGATVIAIGSTRQWNNTELAHLKKLLKKMADEGYSIILTGYQAFFLTRICDECILIKDGMDAKILFKPDNSQELIDSYYQLSEDSSYKDDSGQISQKTRKTGELYGDDEWIPSMRQFVHFKTEIKNSRKKRGITGYFGVEPDSDRNFKKYAASLEKHGNTIYIPSNSNDALLETLTIGENIAMFMHTSGIYKKKILSSSLKKMLQKEFLYSFDFSPDLKYLDELNYFQKKILSIYCLLMGKKCEVLILEEPYLNLREDELVKMNEYIFKINEKIPHVIIYSRNIDFIREVSDPIVSI